MKQEKNLLSAMIVCAVLTVGYTVHNVFPIAEEASSLLEQNVEALTSDEVSVEKRKLKQVDCICSNGKRGTTLKCRIDGDLEDCTPTQQGSSVCYKVNLSGLKLCS